VDFFHARSIDAILEYSLNGNFNFSSSSCTPSQVFGWSLCVDQESSGNGIPTSDADPNGLNLNIPISTPFFLEGSASDPEGDPWTANWVDYNSDPDMTATPQNAHDIATAPLFRWFQPSTDVIRYFPQLSSILNGNTTAGTGEVLPSVGRTMDFRFIVRDNASPYGALACDELTVMVDGNSGPFEVTSQNAGATWQSGDTETITWSVNNTDQAPISASNVDILFSSDGGLNFSVTLASSVTNDGIHDITVPTVNTMEGRIKVQPAGGYIFFDINNADINVSDDCLADGEQIFPSTVLQAEEGDPALMLDMDFGAVVNSFTDNISSSDPNYDLVSEDSITNNCASFPQFFAPNYKLYDFKVTSSGSYSFSRTSGDFPVMNLYSPVFVTTSVCDNWLASNTVYNPGRNNFSLFNGVSASFTAHDDNELTVNDFNGSGVSYTLSLSGPGDVYFPGSPLVGFSYEYVVVNDATGNIDLISPNPDLTSFDVGSYTVYGLSYDDSENVQTYVGGPFTSLETATLNGTICADLSSNSRPIEIEALLPLDFLYFSAEKVKDAARLFWQIDQAVNVSHFEVERYDAKRTEFVSIGQMPWIKEDTDYEFLDIDVQLGKEYLYRIRSVDIDGNSQTTDTRLLVFPSADSYEIYPNPAEHFFQLSGPLDKIQEVRVMNAFGQVIWEQVGPVSSRPISTADWPRSMYYVEIRSEDGFHRFRLVLQ